MSSSSTKVIAQKIPVWQLTNCFSAPSSVPLCRRTLCKAQRRCSLPHFNQPTTDNHLFDWRRTSSINEFIWQKILEKREKLVRANLVKSAIGGWNKIGACRARAKLDEKRLCIFTVWCSSGESTPVSKCHRNTWKDRRSTWPNQLSTSENSSFIDLVRLCFLSGWTSPILLGQKSSPTRKFLFSLKQKRKASRKCCPCPWQCDICRRSLFQLWKEVLSRSVWRANAQARGLPETRHWNDSLTRSAWPHSSNTVTCCLDEGEFRPKESWHPCNSQTTTHQHFNDTCPDRLLQQTTFSHGQFKVHRHICRLAITSLVRSVGHWPRHKWHTREISDCRQKSNFVCFRRRSSKEQSLKRDWAKVRSIPDEGSLRLLTRKSSLCASHHWFKDDHWSTDCPITSLTKRAITTSQENNLTFFFHSFCQMWFSVMVKWEEEVSLQVTRAEKRINHWLLVVVYLIYSRKQMTCHSLSLRTSIRQEVLLHLFSMFALDLSFPQRKLSCVCHQCLPQFQMNLHRFPMEVQVNCLGDKNWRRFYRSVVWLK